MFRSAFAAVVLAAGLAGPAAAHDPLFLNYYIGLDGRPTIPSGTYVGLANPNFNRLSFLFAHTYADNPESNHYHSKGIYVYTGPAANPTVVMSGSNFLPEIARRIDLDRDYGAGPFAGDFVSPSPAGVVWDDLRVGTVDDLSGFAAGTPQQILFNSSAPPAGGRWSGSLAGTDIELQLVSISAGLTVWERGGGLLLDSAGDAVSLGAGDRIAFDPVFVADGSLAAGTPLSARFRLVDTNGLRGDSGEFVFNFVTAVPEPASAALAAVGAAGLLARRARRRATA